MEHQRTQRSTTCREAHTFRTHAHTHTHTHNKSARQIMNKNGADKRNHCQAQTHIKKKTAKLHVTQARMQQARSQTFNRKRSAHPINKTMKNKWHPTNLSTKHQITYKHATNTYNWKCWKHYDDNCTNKNTILKKLQGADALAERRLSPPRRLPPASISYWGHSLCEREGVRSTLLQGHMNWREKSCLVHENHDVWKSWFWPKNEKSQRHAICIKKRPGTF